MLSDQLIETCLSKAAELHVAVVGDLFLDRYLELDGSLTEPSIETGLDAYQVVAVRHSPGAAGTVINNLVALGVGKVSVVSMIGKDGEGFELRRELEQRQVDTSGIVDADNCRTPTYTKPMLAESGAVRELNRIDIKNRTRTHPRVVRQLAANLDDAYDSADALIFSDQVSEPECGVLGLALRERLAELSGRTPEKLAIADSRERIGLFRNVWLKPNEAECLGAAGEPDLAAAAARLSVRSNRPLFITLGSEGILYCDGKSSTRIPTFPVKGPVDIVGAGDSVSAALAVGLCAGLSGPQAAALGNLVASITIQQIGTTGTAPPDAIRRRWQECSH